MYIIGKRGVCYFLCRCDNTILATKRKCRTDEWKTW